MSRPNKYYRRLSGHVALNNLDGLRDVYVPNNTNTAAFYRWIIGNIRELWATLANLDPANTGYYSVRAVGNAEVKVEGGQTVNLLNTLAGVAVNDVSNLPTAGTVTLAQAQDHNTYLRAVNAPLKSWYTLRADIEVIPEGIVRSVDVKTRFGNSATGGLTYEDHFNEDIDFHKHTLSVDGTIRFTVDAPNAVYESPGVLNRENKMGIDITPSDPCTIRIHRLDLYIHA